MVGGPLSALRALERLVHRFEPGDAERKLRALGDLARRRMPRAKHVLALHEALLFVRAYPDDARLLARSERLLRGFARRADLRRFAAALESSGIAGTATAYRFYPPTASRLARAHGPRLRVDWDEFENQDLLERNLWTLLLWAESGALDVEGPSLRQRVQRLKSPRESDAQFLVRRIDALPMHVFARERFAEELDLPLRLLPGPRTPSRTLARFERSDVVFQTRALRHARPDLARDVLRPPLAIRPVSRRDAADLVLLTRDAMVTRARDLEAFMHADERDVRLVDCGDNLQFACIGIRPDRRLLLESVYGFLTLKNGVPIGYVLASALFDSAEIAYNVFDAFRGAEAAHVYGRALATVRTLFGVDTFTVYPYQLGHENEEGLRSGAWWFYRKLGFEPRDAGARRVMKTELAHIRRDPRHRSSRATLRALAAHNVYFELGRRRADVIGAFPLERVGAAVSANVARRFGADREQATAVCADEFARFVGLRAWKRLPRDERTQFERWAPLVACLPGVERWSAADRRALLAVVRAKGGRRESEYVPLFDRHARLRAALARLVAPRRARTS